jgi:hypothetical protein
MKTVQQKYTKGKTTKNEHLLKADIQFTELLNKILSEEKQYNGKKELQNNGFEQLIAESIDESLSSLGPSAKQAVYYHLEKLFNIKKSEIPLKIEEFSIAIEDIFGEGAKLLEIQMMKRLHQKACTPFKYIPTKEELVFTDYMRAYKMI